MKFTKPGMLSGPCVDLEPLTSHHREPLRDAASEDQSIWTYFPVNYNGSGRDFDDWFDYAMERYSKDELYPSLSGVEQIKR
jgi:hypothetical protein